MVQFFQAGFAPDDETREYIHEARDGTGWRVMARVHRAPAWGGSVATGGRPRVNWNRTKASGELYECVSKGRPSKGPLEEVK